MPENIPWSEVFAGIAILVILFSGVVWYLRKNQSVDFTENSDMQINNEVKFNDNEEDDDDEGYDPEIIEMGDCKIYPACPVCKKDIKRFIVIFNNGTSEDYDPGEIEVIVCGECRSPIGYQDA